MHNLLDPAILFFVFGVLAGTIKSNLEIPPAISRFLSLYLLMALGLKGGFALAQSGLTVEVGAGLATAVGLAVIIPLAGYSILKRILSGFDAAAVAATYGSVSAVTFVTAVQTLENQEIAYGGHMAAAMALMECPDGHTNGWLLCDSSDAIPPEFPIGKSLARVLHRRGPVAVVGGHGDWSDDGGIGSGGHETLFWRPLQGYAGVLPARHGFDGLKKSVTTQGYIALVDRLRHAWACHSRWFGVEPGLVVGTASG
jgi:hypothetical protein